MLRFVSLLLFVTLRGTSPPLLLICDEKREGLETGIMQCGGIEEKLRNGSLLVIHINLCWKWVRNDTVRPSGSWNALDGTDAVDWT